jgi:hypothetical protein
VNGRIASIEQIRDETAALAAQPDSADLVPWLELADDSRNALKAHRFAVSARDLVAMHPDAHDQYREAHWFTMTPRKLRLGKDGRPLTKLSIGTPHWQETDSSVGLLREAMFAIAHPQWFEEQGVRYVFRPNAHADGYFANQQLAGRSNISFVETMMRTVRPPSLALNPAVTYPLRYSGAGVTSLNWNRPHPSAVLNMMLAHAYLPHVVLDGHAFPFSDGALAHMRFTDPESIRAFHAAMSAAGAPLSEAPSEFLHLTPVARGVIPAAQIGELFEHARLSGEDMPAYWQAGGMFPDFLAANPIFRFTQYIAPENPKWLMTRIPSLPRAMTQWESVQMTGEKIGRAIAPILPELLGAIDAATPQDQRLTRRDFELFKTGCADLVRSLGASGTATESGSAFVAHAPAGRLRVPATPLTHAAMHWGGDGLVAGCINLAQVLRLIDPVQMRTTELSSRLAATLEAVLTEVATTCRPLAVSQEQHSIRDIAPGIGAIDRLVLDSPGQWVDAPAQPPRLSWKSFVSQANLPAEDYALLV